MATATPQGFGGVTWSWVHPRGIVALPTASEGWFIADLWSWYIDNAPPFDFLREPTDEERVHQFMVERGADPVHAFRVICRPVLSNPWPALDRLAQQYGGGCSGLPSWIDMRPFEELELGAVQGQTARAFKNGKEIWVERNRVGRGAYWLASAENAC